MTIFLWLYKMQKINALFLIFPIIIFLYEMLPVPIPGPFDNLFGFGGDAVSLAIGCLLRFFSGGIKNQLYHASNNKIDNSVNTKQLNE